MNGDTAALEFDSPFRRTAIITIPFSSKPDIVVWAPFYYLSYIVDRFELTEKWGSRKQSYALFLSKAAIAFDFYGEAGLQKLIKFHLNSYLSWMNDKAQYRKFTPEGIAVALGGGLSEGWGLFHDSDAHVDQLVQMFAWGAANFDNHEGRPVFLDQLVLMLQAISPGSLPIQ